MTPAQLKENYVIGAEAARILGVSHVRVIQLAKAGRLPFLETAAGRLYPRRELEQIAKTRSRKAGRPKKGT